MARTKINKPSKFRETFDKQIEFETRALHTAALIQEFAHIQMTLDDATLLLDEIVPGEAQIISQDELDRYEETIKEEEAFYNRTSEEQSMQEQEVFIIDGPGDVIVNSLKAATENKLDMQSCKPSGRSRGRPRGSKRQKQTADENDPNDEAEAKLRAEDRLTKYHLLSDFITESKDLIVKYLLECKRRKGKEVLQIPRVKPYITDEMRKTHGLARGAKTIVTNGIIRFVPSIHGLALTCKNLNIKPEDDIHLFEDPRDCRDFSRSLMIMFKKYCNEH